MPILSTAQTLPLTTQAASLRVAVRLSAAQTMPAAEQAAAVSAPRAVMSAAQTMAGGTVQARFTFGPVRGPATPRPPGSPAVPRT